MKTQIIPSHGGYRQLKSYQGTVIIYDLTVMFCDLYIGRGDRTRDQMIQAARSGKQNIAEGSMASGTSKKTELKLVNVARASQEELLLDYEDFLRQKGFGLWGKDDPRAQKVRKLVFLTNRTNKTYETYMTDPENAANMMVCLINQTNYLLDQQLRALEKEFLQEGGFTERLYRERSRYRRDQNIDK